MDQTKLAQVALIWGTHGVKGAVKVRAVTDDLDLLEDLQEAWVWDGSSDTVAQHVEISMVREVHAHWLFQFVGVEDLDQVQRLLKKSIWIPEDQLRPLEEDEFFLHQVVGSDAYDLEGDLIGKILNCFENGPQLVFEVADVRGGSFLVPGVSEIVKQVDSEQNRVILDLVDGMRDLNRKDG